MKLAAEERFRAKIWTPFGQTCWLWTGATTGPGHKLRYGRFYVGRRRIALAHRWAYERWRGPIPSGLEIDHLCRNPLCVNPAHLEPVTRRENVIRGTSPNAVNAAKTHCKRGHQLTSENVYPNKPTRQCMICAREREQEKRNLASAERNARALKAAIAEIGG